MLRSSILQEPQDVNPIAHSLSHHSLLESQHALSRALAFSVKKHDRYLLGMKSQVWCLTHHARASMSEMNCSEVRPASVAPRVRHTHCLGGVTRLGSTAPRYTVQVRRTSYSFTWRQNHELYSCVPRFKIKGQQTTNYGSARTRSRWITFYVSLHLKPFLFAPY